MDHVQEIVKQEDNHLYSGRLFTPTVLLMESLNMKKYITLSITEYCNLSCIYCYEHYKSNKIMKLETAIQILKNELSANDGYDEVVIDFFGGEPFSEFELIKNCFEYICNNSWNKKWICFATTNGTLLNSNMKSWLTENKDRFWCSLSIDGTPKMHNINRCNSFEKIDLNFFQKNWPKQPVKMTISSDTLNNLTNGVKYLNDIGFPVLCNFAQGIDWSKGNLEILKEQLITLIDYYISNEKIIPCSLLNWRIDNVCYETKNRWCGAGKHMRTYDINGKIYPCHFFMPITLGYNADDKIKKILFKSDDLFFDKKCERCRIKSICPTCYGANFLLNGDVSKRDSTLCDFYKCIAIANSYFAYKKIEKYGLEYVSEQMNCGESDLLNSIKIIQNIKR